MYKFISAFIVLFVILASCKTNNAGLEKLSDEKELYAVIIKKSNTEIFRQFYNQKTSNDLFNIQSETKSIIAILTGIAIDKGFIKSINQPVSDFFPQLLVDEDAGKKEITIQHLLNQTSGLKDFEYPLLEKWASDANPSNLILTQPIVTRPGTVYKYNTAATHLLSAIISKAANMETSKFAEAYLFNPLGITAYKWEKLHDGYNDGGGLSLWMKTEDMLKLGELLINGGQINNQQIISSQWVSQLFGAENKLPAPWGIKNSLHGFCWYVVKYKEQTVNYAMGYGGQFLLIFPGLNAVVAVNYNHDTADGIEQSTVFLTKYLPMIYDKLMNEKA